MKTEQQERDKKTRKCVEGLGNSLNENTTQTKVKNAKSKNSEARFDRYWLKDGYRLDTMISRV